MEIQNQVLSVISNHYLTSSDFNGILLENVRKQMDLEDSEFLKIIIDLLRQNKIDLIFNDSTNPYIKLFDADDIDSQLKKIEKFDYLDSCAYPSKEYLKSFVNPEDFKDKPFTLKMALGEPQLSFYPFDLTVLEIYRNDPRYWYSTDDISGHISITNEYYQEKDMKESDKILLEKFGFCYDDDFNRGVAVFLRYLKGLSPEHQQIWNAKLLDGNYKLHPDYLKITMGAWPQNRSIFRAFIEELKIINEMSEKIANEKLFKNDYCDKRPTEFSFLIRPTEKEYKDFIQLLDKMISDNINRIFFKIDVELKLEDEIPHKDGKVEIRPKGTLSLLEDYLKLNFETPYPEPIHNMIKCFKLVRKARSKPAHTTNENKFDQAYFKKQIEVMSEVYKNMLILRIIFSRHPYTKDIHIPNWLEEGKIIDF